MEYILNKSEQSSAKKKTKNRHWTAVKGETNVMANVFVCFVEQNCFPLITHMYAYTQIYILAKKDKQIYKC